MKKGIAKFTAFCLAAGMTIGEGGAVYFAAPATTMVGVGSDNLKNTVETEAPVETEVQAQAEETEAESQTPETEAVDKSMIGTTGFAQCTEYVNVRSSADAEGNVVGKIYANGSVEILDVDDYGWYHIRSGNVEGYVAGQYIATGDQAASIADSTGYTTAEVGAEVLNVRSGANSDSEIIATLTNAQEIEVVADEGEWVKVALDSDTYGYVSHDYVNTSTSYATGETVEEEQARLDAQWTAYLAQQEAAQAASQSGEDSYSYTEDASTDYTYEDTSYSEPVYEDTYTEDTSYTETTYTEPSYTTDGSDLAAQASALYQTYLDAQAAADAAVANGADEQTVIDTAAAAQNAYASYVAAQNAADAAAAGMAVSTDTSAAPTAAESSVQDTQTDVDAAAAAQAQAEAEAQAAAAAQAQAEAEAAAAQAQASSAGQSVADYATQFVGNPYVWGGASLTGGADCSGFTMAVYANFGVSLPHNAAAQSGCGSAVDMSNLQPGDLLFYGDGISHVAMYIGGGSVVHASNETNGIIISNYNYRNPVCARRYL